MLVYPLGHCQDLLVAVPDKNVSNTCRADRLDMNHLVPFGNELLIASC